MSRAHPVFDLAFKRNIVTLKGHLGSFAQPLAQGFPQRANRHSPLTYAEFTKQQSANSGARQGST